MHNIKNKTALITGASSGIGKSLAMKLAEAGVNLVLVARSEIALHQLAEKLNKTYNVRCDVIVVDLSLPNCGISLLKNIDFLNINIDILINNAGFGTYGRFETIPAELEQDEISVNVSAVVSITHALIPGMIARQSGVILNIASTASFQPSAFMAVYAASKAFVLNFSEALWAEYQDRGIYVAALCPGPVETGFIDKLGDKTIRQTAVFSKTVSAEYVAKKTMKVLQSNHPTHILGFKNWMMINSIRFVPRALVAKVGAKMLKSKLK